MRCGTRQDSRGEALRTDDPLLQTASVAILSCGHRLCVCRLVTGVETGHPRDGLESLGVVPGEDNDPTASICPVCIERRATRVVLGSCGHIVCAGCVSKNPASKCPVCRGDISFLLRVF